MLSLTLQMRDINPEHWARLLGLMLPPPGGDPQPGAGRGALSLLARATAPQRVSRTALSPEMPAIVLTRGGQPVRIVRLGGGTLPVSELNGSVTQEALRALRHRRRLPFVAAVDLNQLPVLWAEAQSVVRIDDDYVAQQLAMLRVFREHLGRSVIVDPRLLGSVPIPTAGLLQRTFDRMLPDGRSLVFYLLEDGAVYTSLIVVKRAGDIELVTTHDAISDVRCGSTRDASAVLRAVSQRLAPPHIGVFLPLRVWQETLAGDRSAIARAMAARRAALDPAPAWLLALVGVGVVAEAATRSGRLAGQLLAASKLGARLLPGKATEKVVQTLSNPLDALGLDPWELLRWGRDWRRRVQLDRGGFAKLEEKR